ncbi:DUF2498 family protein [Salmonella enterica]|nr:DUF2498 family protein [Salmonella enterica]
MHKETQPIDRETLLLEANKIIREHEDTMSAAESADRLLLRWWQRGQKPLM